MVKYNLIEATGKKDNVRLSLYVLNEKSGGEVYEKKIGIYVSIIHGGGHGVDRLRRHVR